MEKTQSIQKQISKWVIIGTGIVVIVLALIVSGLFTWYKIDPKGYWKHINTPIVEWRMKNLRANLIACNKEYGADKYLLDKKVNSGEDRIFINWKPGSGFLPTIIKIFFGIVGPGSRGPKDYTKTVSCIRNISPLYGMKLEHLDLSCTAVNDLSPLRGMPLTKLSLPLPGNNENRKKITDISPLKGMKLKALSVANCNIKDISVLKGMPLERVVLIGTQVTSLEPLKKSPIQSLDCIECPVKDLSPLVKMPLQRLVLNDTKVEDLTPLCNKKIEHITLYRGLVKNISPLQNLPLISLSLIETDITDLSPLQQNKSLQRLYLRKTKITDISPLAKSKTLKGITLVETNITDLTPLFGTKIKINLYVNDGHKKYYETGTPEEIQKFLDASKPKNIKKD